MGTLCWALLGCVRECGLYGIRTWLDGFPFDSRSPAAPMLTTGNFEKLGRNFNIVEAVLENLYAALTRVKYRPCVTIKSVALVACMACL